MDSVKIAKIKLLGIVRDNRDAHIKAYLEAVEDYKKAVLLTCQGNLMSAQVQTLDAFKGIKHIPPPPTSYETAYGRAIRMLELSEDIIIELEAQSFNQLVLDEWTWKDNFAGTNAVYKSMI